MCFGLFQFCLAIFYLWRLPIASMAVTMIVAPLTVIAAAVVTTPILAVIPVVVTIAIAAAIVPAIAVTPTTLLIARRIFTFVPLVLNKIDTLATGAVFVAVLAPVLGMAGRDAQVDRRTTVRNRLDQDRLPIDDRGTRITADVDLAVEAGLADADRDAHISGVSRRG